MLYPVLGIGLLAGLAGALRPDHQVPPLFATLAKASQPMQEKAAALFLVQEATARCAIVASASLDALQKEALDQFVILVERSTGVRLPVVPDTQEAMLPPETIRLFVGDSPQMRQAGLIGADLPEEGYRIVRRGRALYVIGRDTAAAGPNRVATRPTLWALNRLLEEGLGIRWLWPGELGTYTPRKADFPVTASDLAYQPALVVRNLRIRRGDPLASMDPALDVRLRKEAMLWAENHQCGRRAHFNMGHAFTQWWEKYGKGHPDYFAQLPAGRKQPYPRAERVKLRLSNPAVIDRIAKEYEAAGKPEYWNVCPNDGEGWDTSEATRAWDIPSLPITDIFHAHAQANLTARFVEFWNRLYERLATLNPDVKLVTYGYSAYRTPPPPERPLKARAVIGIVNSFDDDEAWKGWSSTGASLVLRPNWWHLGKAAPYLPLEKTARYLKFAHANGMIGMDMDSLIGYWGAQGINYYLGARLMTRPELTLEEIIDEYTSAFGGGATKIREYIAYWQKKTDEYNYPMIWHEASDIKGRYSDLVREGKIPSSILSGGLPALVYLYTDEVVAPAHRLLDEAAEAAGDAESRQRVEFLRRGLHNLEATRNQVARGLALRDASTPERLAAFIKGGEELARLREAFSADHSTWGVATSARDHRKRERLLWPQYLKLPQTEENEDGLL